MSRRAVMIAGRPVHPMVTLLGGVALGVALGCAMLLAAPALAQDAPAVVRDFEEAKVKAGDAEGAKPPVVAKKKKRKTVTLKFATRPRVAAKVYYGRKLLGTTPFSVQWKHDSGPLDLIVRAPGYLTVVSRAYTFDDDDVIIPMTRPSQAHRLLGYKKPIESPEDAPEEGEGADGAEGEATPAASAAPGAATATPAPGVAPAAPVAPATPAPAQP